MSDPVVVIDRPRSGGQAAGSGQPHTVYTDGDTFNPVWWGPAHGSGHDPWAAINALYSQAERTLSTSATILDNIIPVVYGSRKVVGLCGARWVPAGRYVHLGFVFSFGEQASVTDIRINDEAIDDLPWVTDYLEAVGNGTTDLSGILTVITGWTAADTALWKTLCHLAVKIDYYQAQMPSALKVTAVVGGKKIDTTWRTGGSASVASTNPVEIGYHVMTDPAIWRGVDTAKIHTASWESVADWCDEVMADSTDRWSFNGIIQHRDPDAALSEVLAHCFATPFVDYDGKVRLWSEMPPSPITGTWSCDGTTVTEDGSVGEATTELSAGDVVYVGSSLRTVASVTDDDTFEITATATETAQKVRPISGVAVSKLNWIGALEGGEDNANETPQKIVVRWTDPDEWGNREEISTYGSPDPDYYRQTEVTYTGCTNASMAARLGTHLLRTAQVQPYFWTGVADGTVADLEPGDVFQISDDVLTSTTVRLLPPKGVLTNGAYQLAMREFDIGVYTDVTATPATGADPGGGWTTGVPDVPTAASQIFGYGGDWINNGLLPASPDNLTTSSWEYDDLTLSYNGTVVATEVQLTGTGGDDEGWVGEEIELATFNYSRVLLTCMVKLKENADANQSWSLTAMVGPKGDPTLSIFGAAVEINPTSEWTRVWTTFDIPSTSHPYLFPMVYGSYSGTPPTSSQETIYVKKLMMIPWELDPQFAMYERWEWTEHGSASSTVAAYQVYIETPSGQPLVMHSVPQGTSELEFPVSLGGMMPAGYINNRSGYFDYDMRALGINGAVADFPAPTQSVEVRPWSGRLASQSDVDLTDRAAGFGLSWDGTEYDHVPIARAYGTGGLVAWEDLRVAVTATAKSGTNDPGFAKVKDNGSSSTGVFAYLFDASTEESLFFTVQMPHAWKAGTDIKAHVHWTPTIDSEDEDNIVWGLEYAWANIDAQFGNTTLVTGTDTGTFVAGYHYVCAINTISGSGKTESSMLLCRVYRDADSSSDDYAADAALLEIDFHYQVEKQGTESTPSF